MKALQKIMMQHFFHFTSYKLSKLDGQDMLGIIEEAKMHS